MSHNPPEYIPRGAARRYLLYFAPMVILTLIAFTLTMTGVLSIMELVIALLVMAAIQFYLQVYLFMHLNIGRRAYLMAFGAGVFAALLIALALFFLLKV